MILFSDYAKILDFGVTVNTDVESKENEQLCVYDWQMLSTPGFYACHRPLLGRYVKLQHMMKYWRSEFTLHLCEFEVLAESKPSKGNFFLDFS